MNGYKTGKIVGTSNIFSVSNLSPGTEYTFDLTCLIGGIELPGLSKIITAQTKACPGKWIVCIIGYEKLTHLVGDHQEKWQPHTFLW